MLSVQQTRKWKLVPRRLVVLVLERGRPRLGPHRFNSQLPMYRPHGPQRVRKAGKVRRGAKEGSPLALLHEARARTALMTERVPAHAPSDRALLTPPRTIRPTVLMWSLMGHMGMATRQGAALPLFTIV